MSEEKSWAELKLSIPGFQKEEDNRPWEDKTTIYTVWKPLCPECKIDPPNLFHEESDGDVVCTDCGLVLGQRQIDHRREWRVFNNDDGDKNPNPERTGEAGDMLLDDGIASMGTKITEQGSTGFKLARSQKKQNANSRKQKNLDYGHFELKDLANLLDTGHLARETAQHVLKLAYDYKYMTTRPSNGFLAGCLFLGCRQARTPRTFAEIRRVAQVPKKELAKNSKFLEHMMRELEVTTDGKCGIVGDVSKYAAAQSTTAAEYISRLVPRLGYIDAVTMEKIAMPLCDKARDHTALHSRSPMTIAGACLYMARYLVGQPRSAKDVAEVAGVSKDTLVRTYKLMYVVKDRMIHKDWIEKGTVDVARLPPVDH